MTTTNSLAICQYDKRLFFAFVAANENRKLKKTSTYFFQAVDHLVISVGLAGLPSHLLDKYCHMDSVLGKMPVPQDRFEQLSKLPGLSGGIY